MIGPLDFLRADARPNPYPSYAALREAGVVALPGGGVAVADYASCWELLHDERLSNDRSKARPRPAGSDVLSWAPFLLGEPPFIFRDPPDHTRLRGLVSKAFTRRTINALETGVVADAESLLAAAGNPFELVSQFAYPLPVGVICALLGIPASDRDRFARWSWQLSRSLDPQLADADPLAVLRQQRAGMQFGAYLRALFAERRAEPKDDLISSMLAVESEGARFTEFELVSTCIMLLVAGHETTVSLIGSAMLWLLRNPEQWARLVADPTLAGNAVEESLRFDPPVQMVGRFALEPMQIGSVSLEVGDPAMLVLGGAARDPAVFPDPDRFDIGRTPDAGLTRHLAFASGIHYCLGAPLARMEAAAALRVLAANLTNPTIVGEPAYREHLAVRGLAELRIATS